MSVYILTATAGLTADSKGPATFGARSFADSEHIPPAALGIEFGVEYNVVLMSDRFLGRSASTPSSCFWPYMSKAVFCRSAACSIAFLLASIYGRPSGHLPYKIPRQR